MVAQETKGASVYLQAISGRLQRLVVIGYNLYQFCQGCRRYHEEMDNKTDG